MFESLSPDVMPREGDALDQALLLADRRIENSGNPGSILLIADAIEPGLVDALSAWRENSTTTIQWLAPVSPESAGGGNGDSPAVTALSAQRVPLSPDDRDIASINRRSKSALITSQAGQSERWRDDGYWLVPVLVVGLAFWSRRGWSIRTG